MSQEPYAYENRSGLYPISWAVFHGLCKGLAQAVAEFDPQLILAVGRGGFYPGALIAHILRTDIYPVYLSRRVRDEVRRRKPRWLVKPPKAVKGRRVLVVDEICDTGETLVKIRKRVEKLGAKTVRTAVLYAHSHGADVPDFVGLVSDALILNPWDREIYADGGFAMHPEYVGALAEQGIAPDASLLIDAPLISPARPAAADQTA